MYAYHTICILLIIQKNASNKNQAPPDPAAPQSPLLRTRFSPAQLLLRFHRLLPMSLLADWLAISSSTFYERAFTLLITLWYLIFQRLCDNHSLSHVQEDALSGGADRLGRRGKRLSRQLRSEATTSYNDARQRLPLEVCKRTLQHVADQTHRSLEVPLKLGFKLAMVDGSTFRMRGYKAIGKKFPPHRPGNCKKQPYWCVARVLGILCWGTGVVLGSAVGSLKCSEQSLCAQLLVQRCWHGWLLVADRNFGVYSAVRSIVAAKGQVLVRLTARRAHKLARAAGVELEPGLDVGIEWVPSPKDKCPRNLPRTSVAGRLLVVQVKPPNHPPRILYLFTTLTDREKYPASELAAIYGLRWTIEICFRYIKAQMDLGCLQCQSAEMAEKEWLAGLIAYNLIRWTMGAAAAVAEVPVEVLSFSRARELLVGWCVRHPNQRQRCKSWQRLLERIANARLPKRRKARPPEPRAIRHFHKDVARLEGSRAAARARLMKMNAKS